MRASLARAALIGFGLGVGLAAVCAAEEVPTILVTSFSESSGTTAVNSDLESRLVQQFESVAKGAGHAVLDAGSSSTAGSVANDIRALAASAGASHVLVGAWLPAPADGGGLEAAVELRSGHSGAPEHRYRLRWDTDERVAGALEAEIGRVVRAIVEDLQLFPRPQALASVAAVSSDVEQASGGTQKGKRLDFLTVDRDQPIEISSDELEVIAEGRAKHLIFDHNVRIVQGEMRVFAGHLEAFYPEGASQPERLEARGKVRVVEGDIDVRCLEATYMRTDGLVICRGDVLLVQGCDEVRGREIEFYLDEERVKVIGAASVVLRPDQQDASSCERGSAG